MAVMEAVWFVSVERPGFRAEWDVDTLGTPDPTDLLPTRTPSSGDFSRHIPRRAHARTTGAAIGLESGLEHDLLRWLDLRSDVVWIVGQPVRFHFPTPQRRKAVFHTPDLLSQDENGSVTLWNARPAERHNDDFAWKVELTTEACRRVGWRHELFNGFPTPMRMNLLWLNGYRRPTPWHAPWVEEIQFLFGTRERSIGELRQCDDGSGEFIATMWHLIATGVISCDLSRPIRDWSTLNWTDVRGDNPGEGGYRPELALVPDTLRPDPYGRLGSREADR